MTHRVFLLGEERSDEIYDGALQPELFVLMPPCGGLAEWDRRKELLRRHVERVKITSNPETLQPPVLQLQNIR